jgi:hypothetical protein
MDEAHALQQVDGPKLVRTAGKRRGQMGTVARATLVALAILAPAGRSRGGNPGSYLHYFGDASARVRGAAQISLEGGRRWWPSDRPRSAAARPRLGATSGTSARTFTREKSGEGPEPPIVPHSGWRQAFEHASPGELGLTVMGGIGLSAAEVCGK